MVEGEGGVGWRVLLLVEVPKWWWVGVLMELCEGLRLLMCHGNDLGNETAATG
jgi:hypothetical protein